MLPRDSTDSSDDSDPFLLQQRSLGGIFNRRKRFPKLPVSGVKEANTHLCSLRLCCSPGTELVCISIRLKRLYWKALLVKTLFSRWKSRMVTPTAHIVQQNTFKITAQPFENPPCSTSVSLWFNEPGTGGKALARQVPLRLPYFHLSTHQFWEAVEAEMRSATSPEKSKRATFWHDCS
jgi:hypothetical protein